MSRPREVRSYDYVNHPYEQVRDALRSKATQTFRSATVAASTRAHDVASALRVNLAGIEIAKDIVITVENSTEERSATLGVMVTRIQLAWEAAQSPRLFPLMRAELSIYTPATNDVKLVEGDPPVGVGDVLRRRADAGARHVHRDDFRGKPTRLARGPA